MNIRIKNANVVNEGIIFRADLLIQNGKIARIIRHSETPPETIKLRSETVIDAAGKHLIPGIIDDQVHFREPGLTHKADIFTESRAAIAGGVTSFMEMPNTIPNVLTQELLEQKYQIASEKSYANYSFFMGASNDNIEEVLKTNPRKVCGVKVFMGASTGNMLVDNMKALENIFSQCEMLIATHCEDEAIIKTNLAKYKDMYGETIPVSCHPSIRSSGACYSSSSLAVEMAHKYNTRLHVLHVSTARELSLFGNSTPLKQKRITAEACIHHLWFDDNDYQNKGAFIKWNPAIKTTDDKAALLNAVSNNHIDVIATDHAPHTKEEKQLSYMQCPSGGPMVQHSLAAMLEFHHRRQMSIEKIVEKMCHAPADCFRIEKRGYIREGYYADLVLVDLNAPWTVDKSNILYKCGWSPFEGQTFRSRVTHTFVNGQIVYENGSFNEDVRGERLLFFL